MHADNPLLNLLHIRSSVISIPLIQFTQKNNHLLMHTTGTIPQLLKGPQRIFEYKMGALASGQCTEG